MTDIHPRIRTAVPYPLNRVVECIGRDYLTSTPAYALALAITEGVDEIKLYGVHDATEREYIEQRPCLEWLLGLAEGRGIKLVLPALSPLLRGERYPNNRTMELAAAQERLDFNRDEYMGAWAKTSEYLGAYRALEAAGMPSAKVKRQYLEAVLRCQQALGKYKEGVLTVHRLGGMDINSTKLPDLEVPAKLLTVEDVVTVGGAVA